MRLLFSVNNFGFLRNFEPALRLLAARGHDLHLVAERKDSVGGMKTIENLTRAHPGRVTFAYAPSRKDALWQPLAVQLRLCLDSWRYLDPRYDQATSLRARAARQAPVFAQRLPGWPILGSRPAMRLWQRLGHALERAIPPGEVAEAFLREQKPDLLLLTPLLYFGSQQVEYVRAAKAMGIRTVLGVGSWDHLTTKGLIHELPDRLIVWNEMQRQEAVSLHQVPADRVTVTGAQAYDHWFTTRPSTTREAFCAKVGVPADRPLLLYLCSSPFITPYEVGFVTRWIQAIRQAPDPVLRGASILIRPHPQNAAQWKDFDPSAFEAVGIWPRSGANPVDTDARADYYDSMFHSAAVVGVNTSALIESGIVGRQVYTVLTEEFAGQQEGTLHFQHLKNVNGGLLHVGATLAEHLGQLTAALREGPDAARSRAFVESFVRPYGLETPAAERFADAVEAEAATPASAAPPTPVSVRLRRLLMQPLAVAAKASAHRRKAQRKDVVIDKDAGVDETPASGLSIVFAIASPEFLRYFDSTMKELADRGHRVSVAVSWLRERKHARMHLVDDDRITVLGQAPKREDIWTAFSTKLRGTMDFVRYLHPNFANTPALRHRMYRKVLPRTLHVLNRIDTLSEPALQRLLALLRRVERAVPVSWRIAEFLREQKPDVVVVSPLVDAASDQVDVVRAARRTGTPAIVAVASWDNLTNKGLIRVEPDLVTVWNEYQKAEAIQFHDIPAERIAVTGAQLFDRWFDRQPALDRTAFCRMVGLPDERPFVLFTGSSVFIARSEMEVPFVRRWIEALRRSDDPLLRDVAVLVRPHPFNPDAWITADFSDLGPVAIWPRERYTPAAEEARSSFFDSLFHCAAVVGINTSAMIEASILRRPVLSILSPEFAGTQEGTVHFRYLLPENGGFLRVASSIEAHVPQLDEVLRDPEVIRQQTERFVERFLRPHGLFRPCTPILADVVEGLAKRGATEPEADTIGSRLLRLVLLPFAVLASVMDRFADARPRMRKAAYEAYDSARRGGRLAGKRVWARPLQVVLRGVSYVVRTIRRWRKIAAHVPGGVMKRARRLGMYSRGASIGLWRGLMRGLRQARRSVRHARYHIAMRVRGASGGVEGRDR